MFYLFFFSVLFWFGFRISFLVFFFSISVSVSLLFVSVLFCFAFDIMHCGFVWKKCVDRMQIGVYFGGARSLWWALFVYFYFRKKSTFFFSFFFEGTLDRTMRPKCSIINFCSFQIFNQWVNFFKPWSAKRMCILPVIVPYFIFFIFVLPSLLLHYGFGCVWEFMAISVLRVFAYLHVSSRTK